VARAAGVWSARQLLSFVGCAVVTGISGVSCAIASRGHG